MSESSGAFEQDPVINDTTDPLRISGQFGIFETLGSAEARTAKWLLDKANEVLDGPGGTDVLLPDIMHPDHGTPAREGSDGIRARTTIQALPYPLPDGSTADLRMVRPDEISDDVHFFLTRHDAPIDRWVDGEPLAAIIKIESGDDTQAPFVDVDHRIDNPTDISAITAMIEAFRTLATESDAATEPTPEPTPEPISPLPARHEQPEPAPRTTRRTSSFSDLLVTLDRINDIDRKSFERQVERFERQAEQYARDTRVQRVAKRALMLTGTVVVGIPVIEGIIRSFTK